jgi:hydrophobe/amphiphile efflux-1 (HAE1) family protein
VSLTEVCIKKPVLAWMIMAATVVAGLLALTRIGVSQFADVDFPTLTVSVTREGAAPEVMEQDVAMPLEEAIVQVEGIRSLFSSSRQGGATITIELDLGRDVDVALQDVQTRVAQAQQRLPRDIDPPIVTKTNPEDNPILWVGVSGTLSRQAISDYARYRVKERLQTVPGVGEIMLGASIERNVRVWIDAARLDERGLTVSDVLGALRREHVELPAGRIETEGREMGVRVLGEALDLDTFRRIVVRKDPSPVYLEDVSLVEDGFEDVRRSGRLDGEPAQGLGVKKQRGANAVAVAKGVREVVEELRASLPEGLSVTVSFDSSTFVEESVEEIRLELLLAVALTALVCWMFLGSLSSTLNVILAIPMSLLGTIAIIYFLGYTLNTFTLLGLSLAVGIVVDDAIMVLENIVRHAELGKDRVAAASEGTREITFAALAATLAVCAIFLPVVFIEGTIGLFFMQFGVTLSIAVMLSYLEAITLAPARCAQMLSTSRHGRNALGRLVDEAFDRLRRGYAWLLVRSLRFPIAILALALGLFAGAYEVLLGLPAEQVPSQDQSRFMVRLTTAVGSDLEATDRIIRRAEDLLRGKPEVLRTWAISGVGPGGGVNGGMFFVTLVPPEGRRATQQELAGVLRKDLNAIPGLRAGVMDLSQSGFTGQRGYPVELALRGSDFEELAAKSEEIKQELAAGGAVVDLDSDYRVGMPELRIQPDRARASDLGVSIEDVATTINALVGGVRAGRYTTGGRRIDVRVRLLADQRSRPEALGRLRVRGSGGHLVPLSALVSYKEEAALQAITRRDRERAITIYGNVPEGHSQDEALAQVAEIARRLPDGMSISLSGASRQFEESMDSLYFALLLGIVASYMILAGQFNSFLHPITVLTILPLSMAGAVFALAWSGKSISVFSMIGLLLLMGIVKKNSIILVDCAAQARARGADALSAMLEAGPLRLRPILMTSTATMMAAVPAALALGPGSETRGPMAIAVLGGLVVSTLLSLLVVPAFYVVADRAKERLARASRRAKPGVASATIEQP